MDTMRLGLEIEHLLSGKFSVVGNAKAAAPEGFEYKTETLVTLRSTALHRTMRSMIVNFAEMHTYHLEYTKTCLSKAGCQRHMDIWSQPTAWSLILLEPD